MKIKQFNRTEKSIRELSPQQINKYKKWVKDGKPKQYTVYLLHDKNLKIKKIGRSTKHWSRIFNGLNHRYFYNFNLLDIKYFKNKSETIKFELKLQKFYKDKRVEVLTYAYNIRKDIQNHKGPKKIQGILANGGSENYKAEQIPDSFLKINKDLKNHNDDQP